MLRVALTSALLVILGLAHVVSASANPLLVSRASGHCFPLDTPVSEMCHESRCIHLHNNTDDEVEVAAARLTYGCNVTTVFPYEANAERFGLPGQDVVAVATQACLQPVCYCREHHRGGSCRPTVFNDCETHTCVQGS